MIAVLQLILGHLQAQLSSLVPRHTHIGRHATTVILCFCWHEQVLHGAAPGRMAAEESPEPRDIYWFNTRVTQAERKRRHIIVEIFLFLLYGFYVVPVTLLYLLLSADSVTSYASWIKYWYENVSRSFLGDFPVSALD